MVHFDGSDDSTNRQNVSQKKKRAILVIAITSNCLTSTFDSATLSKTVLMILEEYSLGFEVILCTSLFVLGYVVLWGSLSDVYGRKLILILTSFFYSRIWKTFKIFRVMSRIIVQESAQEFQTYITFQQIVGLNNFRCYFSILIQLLQSYGTYISYCKVCY